MNYQEEKLRKTIYYSNNKVPKNKLIKEIKDLYLENYRTLKKERKVQINGSIYYVHGLEKLTSLKCPYYPKQSIYSMQFL